MSAATDLFDRCWPLAPEVRAALLPLTMDDGGAVMDAWTSPVPLVYRRPRPCTVPVRTVVSRPLYTPPGADRRAMKAHNIRKLWGY